MGITTILMMTSMDRKVINLFIIIIYNIYIFDQSCLLPFVANSLAEWWLIGLGGYCGSASLTLLGGLGFQVFPVCCVEKEEGTPSIYCILIA